MSTAEPWRLIVDLPADGAWNLAVDEAILDGYAESTSSSAPTLRLYGWDPPALSLGSSQRARESRERLRSTADRVDLVRRPTGGGTVLHHRERTYSVCARLREAPFGGGVVETYRELSRVLAEAIRRLGVEAEVGSEAAVSPLGGVCFERVSTHEICAGGRKLIGSAQLRRRGAFLQHGSIPLRFDRDLTERVIGRSLRESLFTDLLSAAGRAVDAAELDRAIVAAFESRFGVTLRRGRLTEEERARAERLRAEKYTDVRRSSRGRAAGPGSAA